MNTKELFDIIQCNWFDYSGARSDSGGPLESYGLNCYGVGAKSLSASEGISSGLQLYYKVKYSYRKIRLSSFVVYPCAGFVLENEAHVVCSEYVIDVKSEAGFLRSFRKLINDSRKFRSRLVRKYGKVARINDEAKSNYLRCC